MDEAPDHVAGFLAATLAPAVIAGVITLPAFGPFAFAVFVAAFVIGSKLLLENLLGVSLEPLARSWMANAGAPGAAAVIGLLAVDIFIPVPSSVVMVLSGAAFGVLWGSVLAFIGSIGGEWLGFELARKYGTSLSARFIGDESERQRLNRILAKHGAAAIAVTLLVWSGTRTLFR